MLVNCPRCGFTQPQDKYCARCGVDMESFRPPQPSFLRRTLGNPVLQIALVLGIAGVVGFGLYQKRRHELAERMSYLKGGGAQVARSLHSSAASSPEDSPEGGSAASESAPRELVSDDGPEEVTDTAGTAPGPAVAAAAPTVSDAAKREKAADPAKPAANKNNIVRFTFAEVNQQSLLQIFEESRSTGQFNSLGDYVAGILPDAQRRLGPRQRDIKSLAREEKPIAPGQAVQFFQGIRAGEPDSEMGFTYYIELSEGENGLFRGNLEIVRSWRVPPTPSAPQPTMQKTNFPAVFELMKGAAFFMSGPLAGGASPTSGFMPRANLMEPDMPLLSVRPFQILRSNDFRSYNSEYVLFVEFE
ncbi:MAG: hypothetical protein KF802_06465 [Bdellovibrionaceae bacterium]|nr:hypothetical protein [Pseudobdellovibrionaceae bacterium]MBX3032566.1 hypothetical protein [Pseudobdellovibrionaceae bacterium]